MFFVKKNCIIIASGRKWCIVGQKWKIVVAVGNESSLGENNLFQNRVEKSATGKPSRIRLGCLLGSLTAGGHKREGLCEEH